MKSTKRVVNILITSKNQETLHLPEDELFYFTVKGGDVNLEYFKGNAVAKMDIFITKEQKIEEN